VARREIRKRQPARLRVLVGAAELALARVDALAGVTGRSDWLALIQRRLLQEMGHEPSQWTVAFDLLPGRKAVIACAMPTARRAAVAEALAAGGWQAVAWRPAALQWAELGVHSEPNAAGLVVQEPGAVTSFGGSGAGLSAIAQPAPDPGVTAAAECERLQVVLGPTAAVFRKRFDPPVETTATQPVRTSPPLTFADCLQTIT
jgi:hypothetical protein